MSKEIEKAVADMLTAEGIKCEVFYRGERKRDEWQCDAWEFIFTTGRATEVFEYFTGLGHRVADKRETAIIKSRFPNVEKANPRSIYAGNYRRELECAKKPAKPGPAGILHSLMSEAGACDESFASWCSEFGYDTDSRKALATYEACQENGEKFRRLFSAELREKLAELLQDY